MKKTLAALAVLGAFAGSAFAANVTLYGIIDTGLVYGAKDTGLANTDTVHNFTMNAGTNSANRFGLKGEEELGNGLTVGFSLENGFNSDDGTLGSADRLFDRESLVYVRGGFGEIALGRAGELASGNGRYGIFGGAVSPFSTGWGDYIPGMKQTNANPIGRLDNSITYKTPKFAGINVFAQYSLKNNNKDLKTGKAIDTAEGKHTSDREWALGATWAQGPANVSFVVTQIDKACVAGQAQEPDDPLTINLGGAYDFGVVKAFAATSYWKDAALKIAALNYVKAVAATATTPEVVGHGVNFDKTDGFGINVGVTAPVLGGTVKANVGYMNAEQQVTAGDKPEITRYTAAVGYEYPLSKRTFVYTAAGYFQDSYKKVTSDKDDAKSYGAVAGLVHKF